MDEICAEAVRRLVPFAELRSIPFVRALPPFRIRLCIMPDGDGAGELNDLRWRFRIRKRITHNPVNGYYEPDRAMVYMRNDVFDEHGQPSRAFRRTLAHELWHAFAEAHHAYPRGTTELREADEALAQRFEALFE